MFNINNNYYFQIKIYIYVFGIKVNCKYITLNFQEYRLSRPTKAITNPNDATSTYHLPHPISILRLTTFAAPHPS